MSILFFKRGHCEYTGETSGPRGNQLIYDVMIDGNLTARRPWLLCTINLIYRLPGSSSLSQLFADRILQQYNTLIESKNDFCKMETFRAIFRSETG